MQSADLIRSYGRSFARGDLNEEELRNKIEKMYADGLTHIPQHGMAFKGGLNDEDCDGEREQIAIEILTDIDTDFNKTDWMGFENDYKQIE